MGHPGGAPADKGQYLPRLIAWELTRSCMLACKHCRAAARTTPYEGELTTEECFKVLDNIASFAKPIMILTGGEPMLRPDIYEIAAYSNSLGMRTVMAPCGALIDDESAGKMLAAGIKHISISIDGATAESHDAFRGVDGAFAGSMEGLQVAKRGGLDFQINTTITQHNINELPAILELAVKLGASVFNPFLLVPTGRGKDLVDQEISPEQYEQTLRWLAGVQNRDDIYVRVTCAPHYQRILRQSGNYVAGAHPVKGCMGGQSFAFISHRGVLQICGFLDTPAGDLRAENLDFKKIWDTSELFLQMRDLDGYQGRCGRCEYAKVCGGCRARAFAMTGDYLNEEPFCTYEPKKKAKDQLDDLDEKLMSIIQTDFPVTQRPFDALADELDSDADVLVGRVKKLFDVGVIRRLGAVLDTKSLGYVSTLVAARIPDDKLEEVAAMVCELPGVTHNYRRQSIYNLWFTLTCRSLQLQREILDELRSRTGVEDFFPLPALTVYKIRVNFKMGDAAKSVPEPTAVKSTQPTELTGEQIQLVRFLQESLPIQSQPFDDIAEQLAWPVERVIDQIAQWRSAGVIRRFGAVVNHRRLGFTANGMAVLRVEAERIDEIGRRLAERPQVSHCYHRPPLDGFDYNLYAMVHGASPEEVLAIVANMIDDVGPFAHEVLFSTAEYKKTSMKYFT